MDVRMKDLVAFALGALGAVSTDFSTRQLTERERIGLGAAGLLAAAAIYPAARRQSLGSPAEQAIMLAAGVVGAVALVKGEQTGRLFLAAGWLAHAGFDAMFEPHSASRIPSWYPAMCAGYDVALAASLARSH